MKPDLTTRRGIDAEIQRLADEIADIKEDYCSDLEDIIEGEKHIAERNYHAEISVLRKRIKELETLKESVLRPYERVRPIHESTLMGFGVGL